MDTIVRPPDSPPATGITRPRRRWSLAILFIPLVAGALILLSAWISNYDPFVTGTRGYGPQDPRMRVTEVSALGAEGRVFTVSTSGATRFRYTFSIVNGGPVAVTIRGVGSPLDEPPSEVAWHPVRIIPDEQTPGPDGNLVYEPWHPFVLQPGKEAGIEMQVTFRPSVCLERRTTLSWWPETIRFSVFGIPRQTTFESNLEVHITGTRTCPSS